MHYLDFSLGIDVELVAFIRHMGVAVVYSHSALIYIYIYLFIYLCIFLFIHLFICLYTVHTKIR